MRIEPRPGCSPDSVPEFIMNAAPSSVSVEVTVVIGGSGQALFCALAEYPAHARVALISRRPPACRIEGSPRISLPTDIPDEPSLEAVTTAVSSLGTMTRAVVVTGPLRSFLL
jgi:hypothetical protein